MNRYARLLLQLCRVRVAHNDVAQSGSIEELRRRRVTFIEHRFDKETSSIRSDMFVLMPLLTELHSEGELHAINTARLRRSCGRASVRRVRRARRGRDYRSDRETLAARAVRDRIRIGDFETAFLQVFAVIEDRTANEECALWIDNQTHVGGWNKNVAVFGAVDQVHGILQARASSSDHSQTQSAVWSALFFQQRSQLARRILGHFDQALVANLVIDCRRSWLFGGLHGGIRSGSNQSCWLERPLQVVLRDCIDLRQGRNMLKFLAEHFAARETFRVGHQPRAH